MRRVKNKRNLLLSAILVLALVIGIGYAYLTSNLSITGTAEVAANTWNIHFENLNVSEGSVTATTPAAIDGSSANITYAITLARPKDYYEFTVDVKNDGTLPGKVAISIIAGLTSEADSVVDYSIKYTNGNPVNVGDILNAGAKKTIKVRVFYNDDISPEDFPSNNLNLNLIYTLQYVQSDESETTTDTIIQDLIANNSSCFTKYNGQVTDSVGSTTTATNVYFDKCSDKRNIIFNNMCWQVIRTTETGGIKMIYNGEPDQNGECGTSRSNHKGIVQSSYTDQNVASTYLYGSSFTYDTSTNEFTLVDTNTATWGDSTYQNLLGKFTCKNSNNICTTMYQINEYNDATTAKASSYTIGDTNYASIGTSAFNVNHRSPAMVGYMFNKVYNYKVKSISSTTKFGSTFTYSNGTYTLSGTTQDLNTLSSANIANTHYTCWNSSGTCNNISYVYCIEGQYGYYIEISAGKSITDAINEMLYNNDVNRYNSSIKGIIDNWYVQKLSLKTNVLEDIIFCNDRNITDYGGWNPDGGSANLTSLIFKNYNITNLACSNETDQFAVSNNKAKLTYPVGLATVEELDALINYNNDLINNENYYWVLSPGYLNFHSAGVFYVGPGGYIGSDNLYFDNGVRPVVSLSSGVVITSGTGAEADPWMIE